MMAIDPISMLFTVGILAMMAGGALYAMYRGLPSKIDGLLPWAYALLSGGVAALLSWQQGGVLNGVAFVLTAGFYMVALLLLLYGFRRFNNQPSRMTFSVSISIVGLACAVWVGLFANEFYLRMATICVYSIMMLPVLIQAVLSGGDIAGQRLARKIISGLFAGMLVLVVWQLVMVCVFGRALKGFDSSSVSNLVFMGGFSVLVFGLFFGLVLLVSGRVRAELASLAYTDPLTTILNRRAFMDEAGRALTRERREHRPSVLLMLDLDHFKRINDRYGHTQGDCVLKQFAERIQAGLRGGDVFARYGGEEFLV
ncbi:GGDEF domain-containing protein [Acidihalobacter ferrooxydans]|uniref:diguanylate cyclase n=1 Tax=Acidihalobacter ferrooxydans TaxID=1765967 RepID=A0A1P8UD53_9GAMM|nr:GGDEF domain-containing protein [Acidihalobacter ferrooxydans]APZ41792.1 hypothetical protein BW247_00685 [Acidihalobacter ferrooxydans]